LNISRDVLYESWPVFQKTWCQLSRKMNWHHLFFTNQSKGYPWEVAIPDNPEVSGAVLADQVKSLDWKARRAEFVCTPREEILTDVVEKTIALLDPVDEEGEEDA
jgi:hypothetical protein